ncbi:MAG: ribosome maturation factor RimP [Methylotenera sp.]|jgi:ribosome maturation factor RimP|nr:MAG: ribosome maturation factor RimP [Methylotenera sp.]HNU66418.1 ribosome maturation factor RimP [Methylotenera sp.]HOY87721.1 ribosome maturation factor RimP [Methylotenera sp.]HPH08426.1 ribosome maturation factor RimP [Methylotenera sp.]HPM50270.1 ribosome maturation factor RimP [Methylotenera sp.]
MQDLQALVEKTVVQLGFELVDFEMSNRGKLLRVFIDKLNPKNTKDSVTIDDCVLVSNQLGNVLTVEHEIDYDRLEVSSAGMDRVLKKEKDFVRFVGERASIKLRVGMQDLSANATATTLPRKTFLGVINGVEDGHVIVEFEGVLYKMALSNIDKARLSPVF